MPKWAKIYGIGLCALLIASFALAPVIGILGSSVSTTSYWAFPPHGFTLHWYKLFFEKAELVQSAEASIYVATLVALVGVAIALITALGLARGGHHRRLRTSFSTLILVPLLIPTISLGVAIYTMYANLEIPINVVTLGAAQLILVLPLIVGLLVVGLNIIAGNIERAATNLGATPLRVFWLITFPLLRPALISAGILAFVRSLDDAAIALFLVSPATITLPVRMLVAMENEGGSLIAATGSVLLILAVVAAFFLDRTIGLEKAFGLRKSASR